MINRPTTIDPILASTAKRWPERPFIHFEGQSYSYGAVMADVDRMARGLIALEVRPGNRVALWMSNRIEWIIAQFAVTRLGAVEHSATQCRYLTHVAGFRERGSDHAT